MDDSVSGIARADAPDCDRCVGRNVATREVVRFNSRPIPRSETTDFPTIAFRSVVELGASPIDEVPICSRGFASGLKGGGMKLNIGGLVCCGVYTAGFAVLNAVAYFTDDIFSAGTFEQISIAPAEIIVFLLTERLGYSYAGFYGTWFHSPYFFYLLNLAAAYLFGWALSAFVCRPIGMFGSRLDRLDERMLDWLDRHRR
jgi:hypothetical protein